MTPEEKAKELINKNSSLLTFFMADSMQLYEAAKQCALIVIDEILNFNWHFMIYANKGFREDVNYWEQVKTEIKKL